MSARADEIESLYLAEHARLERQIRRKVGCSATARDLEQDIFLRLWEKATESKGDASAYLTRCARNAAIDHGRAELRRKHLLGGLLPEQYVPAVPTPLDIAVARDDLRSVDAAIAGLPRQTRHIFLLNRIHGRSFSEIAGVLGISERAVAKHMMRAIATCQAVHSSD